MFRIFIIIFILSSCYSLSQEKKYNYLTCHDVTNGVKDTSIYKSIKGKELLMVRNKKIYLIKTSLTRYYVTEEMMVKIRELNCKEVKIEIPLDRKNINAPKIVRD